MSGGGVLDEKANFVKSKVMILCLPLLRIVCVRRYIERGDRMLFRKTIVAALTCSLALGWSPAGYRAYADTHASSKTGAYSQPVEQSIAAGGGSLK